ncbi:MAG: amino acid adenylation domain-containing protein [Alphaproteobacteria bacterium]|nr:amino acid adenylation domain-containing protein [Alphaproteobacteria bacterium]
MTPQADIEAEDVLAILAGRGARVHVEAGKLRVEAPTGAMTPDLVARIRDLKARIIDVVTQADGDPEALAMNFLQERFWAHAALADGGAPQRLRLAWRLDGPLDIDRLAVAFDLVVARHEILCMRIDDSRERAELRRAETVLKAAVSRVETIADAVAHLDGFWAQPLDLNVGTLFRGEIVAVGRDDDQGAAAFVAIDVHHVVWDGISSLNFWRELSDAYERAGGREIDRVDAALPARATRSEARAAFAAFEAQATARGAADLAYWVDRLANAPEPLNLPIDRPRPPVFDDEGGWLAFRIDHGVAAAARSIAARARTTPFVVYFAAWASFLARLADTDDIIVATPLMARDVDPLGDAIGCFVNTAFLRFRLQSDDLVDDAIRRARAEAIGAMSHLYASPDDIAAAVEPRRDPGRTPLAQAMFDYREAPRQPIAPGLSLVELPVEPSFTPYELTASVADLGAEGARVELQYAKCLFSEWQAKRIADSFEAYLEAFLARPADRLVTMPMLSADAREALLRLGRGPRSVANPVLMNGALAAFLAMVEEAPDAPAIVFGGRTATYAALAARTEAIATALLANGIGEGAIVGVMAARGPDAVAACLAAWRLGAAYLPLDPAYPADRLRFMAADSGAAAVIVDSVADADVLLGIDAAAIALDDLTPEIGALPPLPAHDPALCAYVIYTSGSTGRPKGVANAHGPLANFLSAMQSMPGVAREDVVLAVTTLSFDISILELFLPLCVGATVAIVDREDAGDPFVLADMIETTGATLLQATPATWRLLIDAGWPGREGLKALCGGEAMPPSLAEALIPKVGELWNMYGPTETTVWSSCKRIADPNDITIGGAIAATTLYVVDRHGALRPEGVPGELWIGGDGVAIGYLGRDDLTAERFVDASAFGADGRAYRTGDLARWTESGEIEALGRIDSQVKLRGYRIELEEIDAALDALPQVAKGVAAIRTDAGGEPALVAFIVYRCGANATGTELRRALRQTLPGHMLPQFFVPIDAAPLTQNGKIDRKALPLLVATDTAARDRTPPRNELEAAIASIWRELLPVEDVAITDNFFELGGQSLQAARMASIVRQRTGRRISPRAAIFETLEQLARTAEAS